MSDRELRETAWECYRKQRWPDRDEEWSAHWKEVAIDFARALQPAAGLTAEQVRRMVPDTQWKQYEDAVEKAESVGAFKQLKNAEAVIGRIFINAALSAQPKGTT